MMKIDWNSKRNVPLLNPKFSQDQAQDLLNVISEAQFDFSGHLFILTSGTTSQGKGDFKWVALSKEAFLESADAVNRHLKSTFSDSWLHCLPDFHVGGQSIWARSFLSGAKVFKLDAWNVETFVQALKENDSTLTALVPAQIYDLISSKQVCPPSLRAVIIGGGALSPALYRKGRELGWPLLPTYGMTEVCSQAATASLGSLEEKSATDANCPELQVLSHLTVREAEGGCLQLKGKSLLTAYLYRRGEALCIEDPKKDGWFLSEDRGVVQGDFLRIRGRGSDFVKIGGESVELGRLRELFDFLRMDLSISADMTLLPVPDDRLGHVIHVVADSTLTEANANLLIEAFNRRVLGFEKIRKKHLLSSLPRTALGKLIPAECLQAIESKR